eukprot:TRINITY_DN881_c0_g3_i2.p1 TRINITY_DN881_c0_g3~~TRINITY_DN881_c0_g3_i2.p1  ORF type:complete len:153 (+),score=19.39 TRINITY_DN881_c0_g3_i2:47-505(+)
MADLDLAVPDMQLKKEEAAVANDVPLTAPAKHEPSDKNKNMAEFYAKHNIAEMISRLTGVLMRDKPADPIAHVIQHLLSPEKGITRCEDVTPYMNDESKAYLLKHKIHYLFDEFLNNMLDDMPIDENGTSDVVGYAMTWMRWNKKRFVVSDH